MGSLDVVNGARGHSRSRYGKRAASTTPSFLERGLTLFVVLLTYDGALRKWGLPVAEQLLFVLKDALLLVLLLLFYRKARGPLFPSSVRIWFTIYALWVVLDALNPESPNLLIGLWGIKAHLLYASLVVLLPAAFPTPDSIVQRLEAVYPKVVIPVCLLAFVQLTTGADSGINRMVHEGGHAFFGEEGLVRVAGTFSYISGMAAFQQFTATLGVGLYLLGARSRWFQVALAISLAALPATGSRGVIVSVGGGLLIMFVAARLGRVIGNRRLLQISAVLAGMVMLSFFTQDKAWVALQQRVEATKEEGQDRIVSAFTNAFDHADVAGVAGFGTGTTNNAAVALSGDVEPYSWFPDGVGFEGEGGRIVLELGLVGWVLSMGFRISLLAMAWRLVTKGRSRAARGMGVLAMPFMAMGVYQGNGVIAASYMAVGYWFFVALMALGYREQSRYRRQQASPAIRSRPLACANQISGATVFEAQES